MALSIEQINKLEQENAELKAEIKELQKYQYEQEYLDKEIEEMQKALKTLAEGLNKRQMLLQEIKEIAEENKDTAQYGGICKSILMAITKAEEE